MDLVMIILTVFLGGIVLALATLWARFGPSVNSVRSFFRKAAPTCPLEEEQTTPRGPQRPIAADSDPSGREQVSSRSVAVVHAHRLQSWSRGGEVCEDSSSLAHPCRAYDQCEPVCG